MRLELKTIEKSLDSLLESLIPEEEISPEEAKELQEAEAEMKQGQCIPLEEVLKKHGVERCAKIPNKRPQKSR
jgi:hypothetical protein